MKSVALVLLFLGTMTTICESQNDCIDFTETLEDCQAQCCEDSSEGVCDDALFIEDDCTPVTTEPDLEPDPEPEPCKKHDKTCITSQTNQIIKAISRSIRRYGISGYDPLVISSLTVERPRYQLTEIFNNVEIIGLGETTLVSTRTETVNGRKQFREVYRHNFIFRANATFVFNVIPEVRVSAPFFGRINNLRTTFLLPIRVTESRGQRFLEMGTATLQNTDDHNENGESDDSQLNVFLRNPSIRDLAARIRTNRRDFKRGLMQRLIEIFKVPFFDARKKFYNHTPLIKLRTDNGYALRTNCDQSTEHSILDDDYY